MNQSKRSYLHQVLDRHVMLQGRGPGTGGRVRRRPYDEGVQAWLEVGEVRQGASRDVVSALRYLSIVVRSRLGTCDRAERGPLLSILRSALSTLAMLGSEDAHDVGTYFKTLESLFGGDDG